MDGGLTDDIRVRYWSLVVTACEWRAFGVEEPEVMAVQVFASLDPRKPTDLRALFRAVDRTVTEAYRHKASQHSSLDLLRGMGSIRHDIARPVPLIALSSLRESDRQILQYAYWDDLDPHEIAEVLRTDTDTVHRRLDDASRRCIDRLVRKGAPADDLPAILAEIKPGEHHRRP